MQESELIHFIQKVGNYFDTISNETATTGVPYIASQGEAILKAYTGIITITGSRTGCLYITADGQFFDNLKEAVAPGLPVTPDMVAGEFANTIAGNVRHVFGGDFIISVPIVVVGSPKNIVPLKLPIYTIPIGWRGQDSYLVIGVN